jgi:hypothetical protein
MEWYWKGQRANVTMVGELYHNERDGWMYSEQLFQNGRQTYAMNPISDIGRALRQWF